MHQLQSMARTSCYKPQAVWKSTKKNRAAETHNVRSQGKTTVSDMRQSTQAEGASISQAASPSVDQQERVHEYETQPDTLVCRH